jgi:phosphoribosyl 1,2-cyclic phosphodiesterase
VRALLCGVRGSAPAPGIEFAEVGGHTSCVAIPATGGRWLVLDAGTGLRKLGAVLDGAPLRGSILLTHLHWDHTHGLPFLPNADRPDAEVSLWLPTDGADPVELLGRAMSPPHFPIGPDGLLGHWTFGALDEGVHEVEGLTVTAAEIEHKGGCTYGYRIDGPRGSLAYLPDHSPRLADPERHRSAVELTADVDLLLHDGSYLAHEQATADAHGHATVDDAIELARQARARRLILVHHGQGRTDRAVGEIEAVLADAPIPTSIGREGDWVCARRD